MNPETHLLASWVIGAKGTNNARDCRLVALAGILPDADGVGILADFFGQAVGWRGGYYYYQSYHHFLLHGAFGAVLLTGLLVLFARQKWRVAILCLLTFHLHLLCDLVGSRGPDPVDLWPLSYLGPFSRNPLWVWKGQLPLDCWPNRLLTVALFAWALWLAVPRGYSFVGVFNRRVDQVFVRVLRKWHGQLMALRERYRSGAGA
jgi:inner membrane protein